MWRRNVQGSYCEEGALCNGDRKSPVWKGSVGAKNVIVEKLVQTRPAIVPHSLPSAPGTLISDILILRGMTCCCDS